MNKVFIILILLLVLLLGNTALFIKGYSYIGYAGIFVVLTSIILFKTDHSIFSFSITSTFFVLSILCFITEISYKIGIWHKLDPTKVNDITYSSLIYMAISLIIGIIWSRQHKEKE